MGNTGSSNCNCDISLVIVSSKQLESLLEQDFGATGKGLHEKISSVEEIPLDLQRKLRKIATIRNRLVHEGESICCHRRFFSHLEQVGFDAIPNREFFVS